MGSHQRIEIIFNTPKVLPLSDCDLTSPPPPSKAEFPIYLGGVRERTRRDWKEHFQTISKKEENVHAMPSSILIPHLPFIRIVNVQRVNPKVYYSFDRAFQAADAEDVKEAVI